MNILFSNKSTFLKLTKLFNAILNNEEVTDEMKMTFFPLLELFSNTFNRKFKTYYYSNEILEIFKFENLIVYMQNVEAVDPPTILLKFKLMFVLLFVHLRKDFQIVNH